MQFWDVLKNLKIVIGKKKEVCFLEKKRKRKKKNRFSFG